MHCSQHAIPAMRILLGSTVMPSCCRMPANRVVSSIPRFLTGVLFFLSFFQIPAMQPTTLSQILPCTQPVLGVPPGLCMESHASPRYAYLSSGQCMESCCSPGAVLGVPPALSALQPSEFCASCLVYLRRACIVPVTRKVENETTNYRSCDERNDIPELHSFTVAVTATNRFRIAWKIIAGSIPLINPARTFSGCIRVLSRFMRLACSGLLLSVRSHVLLLEAHASWMGHSLFDARPPLQIHRAPS